MTNSSVQVRDVALPNDIDDVRKLWFDYLTWGNNEMQSLYGVHPHDPEVAVEQDILLIFCLSMNQRIQRIRPSQSELITFF